MPGLIRLFAVGEREERVVTQAVERDIFRAIDGSHRSAGEPESRLTGVGFSIARGGGRGRRRCAGDAAGESLAVALDEAIAPLCPLDRHALADLIDLRLHGLIACSQIRDPLRIDRLHLLERHLGLLDVGAQALEFHPPVFRDLFQLAGNPAGHESGCDARRARSAPGNHFIVNEDLNVAG